MYYVKRLVAFVIDGLAGFLGAIPGYILMGMGSFGDGGGSMMLRGLGSLLAFVGGLTVWYFLVVKRTVETGQSVGKSVMGLRLVSAEGAQFTTGSVIVREIVKAIVGSACFLLQAFVFIDKDQQEIHDKVARSYVREV